LLEREVVGPGFWGRRMVEGRKKKEFAFKIAKGTKGIKILTVIRKT
jgi:hypothetical protein